MSGEHSGIPTTPTRSGFRTVIAFFTRQNLLFAESSGPIVSRLSSKLHSINHLLRVQCIAHSRSICSCCVFFPSFYLPFNTQHTRYNGCSPISPTCWSSSSVAHCSPNFSPSFPIASCHCPVHLKPPHICHRGFQGDDRQRCLERGSC